MKSKFDEALTLFQNGQLNKAKDICLEIIKVQPNNFDTSAPSWFNCFSN